MMVCIAGCAAQVCASFSSTAFAAPQPAASEIPVYGREAVFPEGSVYTRDVASNVFRRVEFPTDDAAAPHLDSEWRALVNDSFVKHRPSKHPFFKALKVRTAHASPFILFAL